MDKQTHVKFNLNNFVLGVSFALDSLQSTKGKQLFSSRRVCFIALKLAHYSFIEPEIFSDILSYAIFASYNLDENELSKIPFIKNEHISNKDFLQIVKLAQFVEENFHIENRQVINKNQIKQLVEENDNLGDRLKENFEDLAKDMIFWLDLVQEEKLPYIIYNFIEDFTMELSYDNLIEVAQIIESKIYQYSYNTNERTIASRCQKICKVYSFDNKDSARMVLASLLYGLGKMYINREFFQEVTLLEEEKEKFKAVPYFTQSILSQIFGFDDIAKLCGSFAEKLDGTGYPYETLASDLSLKERVLAILIIYQALREKRIYREAYTHEEAIKLLEKEAKAGKLDSAIVNDFQKEFEKEEI